MFILESTLLEIYSYLDTIYPSNGYDTPFQVKFGGFLYREVYSMWGFEIQKSFMHRLNQLNSCHSILMASENHISITPSLSLSLSLLLFLYEFCYIDA